MSIISKLGSFGLGAITSKPVKKVGGSQAVKTTSKILGSTAPAVAGGQTASSAFVKGVTGVAKVGGVAVASSAAVAVPVLTATKLYDYIGDVGAKTASIRQYDLMLDLAEKDSKLAAEARDRQLEQAEKYKEITGNLPSDLSQTGSQGLTYYPVYQQLQGENSTASKGLGIWGSAGVTLLVLGAAFGGYHIYKKYKK